MSIISRTFRKEGPAFFMLKKNKEGTIGLMDKTGTDWSVFFNNLPPIGWVVIILCIGLLTIFMYGIFHVILHRNIRFKNFEVAEKNRKELYQTEGKNLLDNQCANAHNLLEQVWIRIYEVARKKYNITDQKELFLLEDISHLIEGQLNYQVKNDLTRNHITEKTTRELTLYAEGKANGYYNKVLAMLYKYNIQLPDYNLPEIMDEIKLNYFIDVFTSIYFGARDIAGYRDKGGIDDDRR